MSIELSPFRQCALHLGCALRHVDRAIVALLSTHATMKLALALTLAAAALYATGCSSTSTTSSTSGTSVATLAGLAIEPVLDNNPTYIPVAQAVAAALTDAADGTLDASNIVATAATIATTYGLANADAAYAQVILTALLAVYTEQTGATAITFSDVTAQAYLKAFASGLNSAILLASASSTARAAPHGDAAILARYAKLYTEGTR